MTDKKIKIGLQVIFLISLLSVLWLYSNGYNNSIGWEVTASAEVIDYPGIKIKGELLDFQVSGEKYLLTENYTGGPIKRNRIVDTVLVAVGWFGLSVVLVSASFFKRYAFLFVLALFTLLINRLNLGEVGIFGLRSTLALSIPFLIIVAPLFYFHEYRPKTNFLARISVILLLSILLILFGIDNKALFLDHFVSHSLFTFSIAGLLFLFALAEENVFAILQLITRGKGGKSNHLHFILLTSIYLVNLIFYYLNKSGYVPNSFSFFDPFVLLAISCAVSFWTLKYKISYLSAYIPAHLLYPIFYGLGIILFSVLGLSFFRGNDATYESFHYFILYFHIGFGFFFLLYLIINFIDPLVQGLEVFKVAYKEQHFPYVSARLGGLMVVLGFYFLATQEPYELLRSGYYTSLGNLEETQGNNDLADQYYRQAAFLGYNTHHSNYQLAWNYSDKGNKYLTMVHFEKAASRFPSPFAYVNYANLDMEINPVKVQATLDQAEEGFGNGEISNNQGILRMKNEEWEKALVYFENARSTETWNRAPLLNKWAAHYKLHSIDSMWILEDYNDGNYGVKSNILTASPKSELPLFVDEFERMPILHRQAYLLAAAPLFEADTLAELALAELKQSTNGDFNVRLRKALAIHYYKKGKVNKAFQMLHYLQANGYQDQKGGFLNDLGKLALDQGAYLLARDYFIQAMEYKDFSAEINRLETMAFLGRSDEIPVELLAIVKKDPALTTLANQILSAMKDSVFEDKRTFPSIEMKGMVDAQLTTMGYQNAFDVKNTLQAIELLLERSNPEAYNIALESIEINPYAIDLLKAYVLTAVDQNLFNYAEAILPRIKALSEEDSYADFIVKYEQLKQASLEEVW